MAPPRKKAKTGLSHDEIWDDSALIQSWDDALEEYQYYHSVHARGERIEVVLEAAETNAMNDTFEQTNSNEEPPKIIPDARGDDLGTDSRNMDEAAKLATSSNEPEQAGQGVASKERSLVGKEGPPSRDTTSSSKARHRETLPDLPGYMVGGALQDEALKGLLMSWYYAGYYTGLHDGRQQEKVAGD